MSEKLPNKIPVFPLRSAIFFPETNLPLNIFEPRYLKMVDKAIKHDGYLGMIQSKEIDGEVFNIGCLGKINENKKTEDGRILINLFGLSRFKIIKEIDNGEPFREFNVNYDLFKSDIKQSSSVDEKILNVLIQNSKKLFEKYSMILNWKELSRLKNSQQIYTLVMISPFSVSEKQKLLEIPEINEIAKTFVEITNFAFYEDSSKDNIIQ
jgi:Uncharacterized protein, similar to the N-terminal domain of Lon protease|tara:strand:+ start:5086 stop:5712 length:627 start_codon:yes stop_codon:yes gene_type:complete